MHTFLPEGEGRADPMAEELVIIIIYYRERGMRKGGKRLWIEREIREKWETKITAKEIEDLFKQRSLSIC